MTEAFTKSTTPVRWVGAVAYNVHNQALVVHVCEGCALEFWCVRSHVRRGAGRYHSLKCAQATIGASGVKTGENNPNWLGGVAKDYRRYQIRSDARHPVEYRARRIFKKAIETGKIIRQPCEKCGTTEDVHGHHDDYSRPLDVRWLCRFHHVEHHNAERAAARASGS